ncbi:MAG: hypothetical protein LBI43_05950 [Streptococcaceae bacterium]|jgi:Tfp pilus assembly protein FimT|nr:hypothetical protein [Streptococcaceae bacterium]
MFAKIIELIVTVVLVTIVGILAPKRLSNLTATQEVTHPSTRGQVDKA